MKNFKVWPAVWIAVTLATYWCVKNTMYTEDYTENTKTVCVENQEKIRCVLDIQKDLVPNK